MIDVLPNIVFALSLLVAVLLLFKLKTSFEVQNRKQKELKALIKKSSDLRQENEKIFSELVEDFKEYAARHNK